MTNGIDAVLSKIEHWHQAYMKSVTDMLAGTPNPITGKPFDLAHMSDAEKRAAAVQVKWQEHLPDAPEGEKRNLLNLSSLIDDAEDTVMTY